MSFLLLWLYAWLTVAQSTPSGDSLVRRAAQERTPLVDRIEGDHGTVIGVSLPALKFAAMEKNGSACGIVIALLHVAWANLLNTDSYLQVGPNTGMVGWP